MSDAIVSSAQNFDAGQFAPGGGIGINSGDDDDSALIQQYSGAEIIGRVLAEPNNSNGHPSDTERERNDWNSGSSVATSGIRNVLLHDEPSWHESGQSSSGTSKLGGNGAKLADNASRAHDTSQSVRIAGELRSCLTRVGSTSAAKRAGRRVRFPEDGTMVTGAMPPTDPWRTVHVCSTEELVNSYRLACESQSIRANPFIEEQLKTVSLRDVSERHGGLCLRNIKLDTRHCEALEQVLRRVRFGTLDLENTQLEDDAACMLFDMIEFYESAVRLSIAHNVRLTLRGWLACSRMLKMTQSIEYLDVRHCVFNEHTITVLARALKLVTHLVVLHLEHSGVSGRVLATLVAALRLNDSVREVYLSDNRLLPSDGVHLASLLKYNRTVQQLDLRNNTLQDVGLMHLCEGLAEQTGESGLRTLVLWNNQITHYSMSAFGRALALVKCLETVNVGSNNVNNEGVHQLKEGLLKNKSLLHFGLKAAKIGCEGAVALAEYIAECPQLQRIDLRGNDIRTGGLMALSLALRVNRTLQQIDLDREPKREPGVDDYAITQKRLLDSISEYTERNVQIVKLKEEVKQLLERQAESVKHSGEHGPNNSTGESAAHALASTGTSADVQSDSAHVHETTAECDMSLTEAGDIGVGEENTKHTDETVCCANETPADAELAETYETPKDGMSGERNAATAGVANADDEEDGPDEEIVVLAEQVTGSEMSKATLEKHQKLSSSPFGDDDETSSSLSTSPRLSAPELLRHSRSSSPSAPSRGSVEVESAKATIRELVMGTATAPISVPTQAATLRVSSSFTPPTSPCEPQTFVRNRFSVSLVSPEEIGVSRTRLREYAANARQKAAAAAAAAASTVAATGATSESDGNKTNSNASNTDTDTDTTGHDKPADATPNATDVAQSDAAI